MTLATCFVAAHDGSEEGRNPMPILVTYGSKRGGTRGLAEMVTDELREEGYTVDLFPAHEVKFVEDYEAVIVGGALYAFRWHRDAKRFVKHHTRQLRRCPTFFFSSGPLDDSASKGGIPPVKRVQALMERVGARGHATFGGRLTADAKGFPASAMAKKHAGDWRDPQQVRVWVGAVVSELRSGVKERV
jgi:menaquinone-dependent protoporphyrinogen oxidase